MSQKRVLTLNVPAGDRTKLHLTPQIAEILRVVAEQLDSPTIKLRKDGIAVYVGEWDWRA